MLCNARNTYFVERSCFQCRSHGCSWDIREAHISFVIVHFDHPYQTASAVTLLKGIAHDMCDYFKENLTADQLLMYQTLKQGRDATEGKNFPWTLINSTRWLDTLERRTQRRFSK